MKYNKILLAIAFITTLRSKCYLQNIDYGIVIETNLASHTNSDPTKPDDGQFKWNSLFTFGAGMYASQQLFDRLNLTTALLFRQRGYTEDAQTAILNSPISYPSLQNRFNYISLDIKGKYQKNRSNKIKISPIMGFSLNTLISRKIESEGINLINEVYPVNLYKENWKTLNLNCILGFSLYQFKKYSLEFEFNRSFTPLLKVETLVVKDWIWSMKLNISVQKLLSIENN
jgi:hypothetical protein